MRDPKWLRGTGNPRLHLAHHSRAGALVSARSWVSWCGVILSSHHTHVEKPSPERELCQECIGAVAALSESVTNVVAGIRYVRAERESATYRGIPAGERVLGGAS